MEPPVPSFCPLMNRRAAMAGLACSALPGPALAKARPVLTMVNTVYQPFVNPPGHPMGEGMDVALAREALKRAGFDMAVELLPWRRALYMLKVGLADLTTTISRRDDREAYLRFTAPYRLGANYCFYTRRGSPVRIGSLDDLRDLRMGVIEGFHYPPTLLSQPGIRTVAGREIGSLVAMLMANRTDCLLVTAIAGAWEIRERGLDAQVDRQPYEWESDSPNYLAFSTARLDTDTVASVSAALVQMGRDGTQARIEQRYRV